ncbi:hypothetical protein WA556_002392 [Blastocystis sp. ATCC 50177/Nand II]
MHEHVITESMILARLHHQNIVKLYEIYESSTSLYLVMELLRGGELFDRLMMQPNHKFSEDYACKLVKDILHAIVYLHDYKNIAHRDLKLGNIMFTDTTPDADLKLIDFGLSKLLNRTEYTHSLVGTPSYIAPEIYAKDYVGTGYTKSCDMWSLGIIAYFMLTGRNPMPAQTNREWDQDLKSVVVPYPPRYWAGVSPEARSFVQGLLQADPLKRMTAAQAQTHPWFRRLGQCCAPCVEPSLVENLQTFQGFNRLKKAAMTAVAYHLNHRELGELREAFEFFDKNQTGTITMEEFQQVIESLWQFSGKDQEVCATLQDLNSNEAKLRELFNGIDFNNTGYIDYSEFLAACLARKEGLKREYAELIFDLIDREGKGVIEVTDLHLFFGESISIEEIEMTIEQTFKEKKQWLTESDLEKIMNTRMITNETTTCMAERRNSTCEVQIPTYAKLSQIFTAFKAGSEGTVGLEKSRPHSCNITPPEELFKHEIACGRG